MKLFDKLQHIELVVADTGGSRFEHDAD